MHSDEDIRPLFERALADVAPMADVVPAAVRLGRRHRQRRTLAVTAFAMTPLTIVGAVGAVPSWRDSTVQWAGSTLGVSDSSTAHERAFALRAAAMLGQVLPARLGEVHPKEPGADSGVGAFEVVGATGRFALTFTVTRPVTSAVVAAATCSPSTSYPNTPKLTCIAGTLQDGTPVTAGHENDTPGPAGGDPISFFGYRGVIVMLALFGSGSTAVPISDAELLAAVTDPRFVAIVDEWAADPALVWTSDVADVTATPSPGDPSGPRAVDPARPATPKSSMARPTAGKP